MYEVGLWGVPSFHLIGADGETLLAVRGQDRLWLVSREIQKALGNLAEHRHEVTSNGAATGWLHAPLGSLSNVNFRIM